MAIDIKAPSFPESVAEGTVATWHKQPGDSVERDELIVEIETDKVVLEVVAPQDGTLGEIKVQEGDTCESEQVLGSIGDADAAASSDAKDDSAAEESKDDAKADSKPAAGGEGKTLEVKAPSFPESVAEGTVATWHKKVGEACERDELIVEIETDKVVLEVVAPADGALSEIKVEEGDTCETEAVLADVAKAVKEGTAAKSAAKPAAKSGASKSDAKAAPKSAPTFEGERPEKRVPMSRMRQTIAKRLVNAQQTAAMLTTYNEVDMSAVMELRKQYKDTFQKVHDTKLGFMGFFVKAATEALKRFPDVNASIDGTDIVYHGYQDIGVAVSSDRGLVVPVLRDTDSMKLADVEKTIVDFGQRARAGKLGIDEMQGGTFTITNGGIFGSLMSTPILNPPQTAILGMHKIQERPMAVNGQVVIRPMMYLALSYDHRMIDGKDAVQFLVAIKDLLEDPARFLLDV